MSDNQKKPKPGEEGKPPAKKTPNPNQNPNPNPGPGVSDASAAAAGEGKSKADLRRERREIQEAQRAKKAAGASQPAGAKKPDPNQGAKQQQSQQQKPDQKASTSQQASKQQQQPQQPPSAASKAANLGPSATETEKRPSLVVSDETGGLVRNESFVTAPDTLKLSKKKEKKDESSGGSSVSTKLKLFHHFEQYTRDYSAIEKFTIDNPAVHPAFIRLGIQSAHERINGSNSRCLAFLNTFKRFLVDYKAPSSDKRSIPEDLELKLKQNVNFLTQCRPLCISMGNAIKELKQIITHLEKDIKEAEAKDILNDEIDKFIHEKILLAAETISKYMLAHSDIIISGTSYAKSKITNDDCLLVYGNSSLVTHILLEASVKFPNMHVVVVDSRPKYKGKSTVDKLLKHNVKCTYVMINAISYIMNKVTKVLLGAHALLANNYVVSTIGTAQIALVAKSFNVPVVVCCETYKFCDKVQTDAVVNNELGNPLDLLTSKSSTNYFSTCIPDSFNSEPSSVPPTSESTNTSAQSAAATTATTTTSVPGTPNSVTLLNLTYDVTPPDLITCVVTDMGFLPCTSVPVVLRLKNRDLANLQTSGRKNQIEADKNI